MKIPFVDLRPAHKQIEAELDAAWSAVKDRSHFVLGEQVAEFERLFAGYCGAQHAIGVGTGLDALSLILQGLSIGAGDEVLVPANTFIATWLAVSHVGARPVPVDCDESSGNMSPEAAQRAITARTKAMIPVHLYGCPAEIEDLSRIARDAGIFLVEDAAQAHGARYRGRPVGTFGIAGAFSFYPTKNLGAMGDGGAIVTDDARLAQAVRLLGNYGATSKYHHERKGWNSRLDELQAALLTVKLAHLDAWNAERRAIAAAYDAAFQHLDTARPSRVPADAEPVWHLYTLTSPYRDELVAALAGDGVQTMIHYPKPPHLQPAYAELGIAKGSYPNAERRSEEILSLPLWPGMTEAQIHHVTGAVQRACLDLGKGRQAAAR
jgi:dTDP-4-amino-4,6-dideoxygalactose transaminase